MSTPEGVKEVKAVLACDLPAGRKIGGFLGHGALKGCSRCLKSFPTENFGEKNNSTEVHGKIDHWLNTVNKVCHGSTQALYLSRKR